MKPVRSAGSEGFADIEEEEESDMPPVTSEGFSTSATVDSIMQPTMTDEEAEEVVMASSEPGQTTGVMAVADESSATNAGSASEVSAGMASSSMEEFQGQKTNGLFQLGQMPSEQKSGPFVDIASTMNKAMSSLNQDQMKAMSEESKSLIETQKNLLTMLQSMKPVLNDGRQLLDTFSGIFGGLNGVIGK